MARFLLDSNSCKHLPVADLRSVVGSNLRRDSMLAHTTIASTYAVLIGLLTTMPAAATPFFSSAPGARTEGCDIVTAPPLAGKIEMESRKRLCSARHDLNHRCDLRRSAHRRPTVDLSEVRSRDIPSPKDSMLRAPAGRLLLDVQCPSRVDSPSDDEFHDPDTASSNVTFANSAERQTFTSRLSRF